MKESTFVDQIQGFETGIHFAVGVSLHWRADRSGYLRSQDTARGSAGVNNHRVPEEGRPVEMTASKMVFADLAQASQFKRVS